MMTGMNHDQKAIHEKRAAAQTALLELPESGVIGLGTGSTSRFFLEALADLVRAGRQLSGVPTSDATRALAHTLGVPLLDDAGPWPAIDVTVDGADEVSDTLDLIKGGGGALTREKIVASASRRRIIIADASKRVRRLGESRAVPVEVLAFGHGETARRLAEFGPATLRRDARGELFTTDGGGRIVDVATGPIEDPAALDRALRAIAGVVETGLFVRMADLVLLGASERLTPN
jgi:ribose 5-phosphate isomerase A